MPHGPLHAIVAARRVASWVGPGAPHPDVLGAIAHAVRDHVPGAEDAIVAHAGAFAAAILLTGDDPSASGVRDGARDLFGAADEEATRLGLVAPGGEPALATLALTPPARPERLALFLAFGAGARVADLARDAAGASPREAAAATSGADAALLARLSGDDAVDRWLAAWTKVGTPRATVAEGAHPGNRPRLVALGFEVARRELVGPLDLHEDAPPAGT